MSKMVGNTPELDGLLVGPYLWSTSQYCDFYHDVSNLVSKENTDLMDLLDAESEQVFGTSSFVEMMGVEYWNILKRDGRNKDRYKLDSQDTFRPANEKNRSLVQLIRLIRDKYEHIDEYEHTVKERLNTLTINGRQFNFFFKDDNEKYQLNKHQFIAFWNSKFPKLGPYLWLKLYNSKNKLSKYYPSDKIDISHFQKTKLNLTGYVEGLRNALTCDLENGNVFQRLKGLEGRWSLEIRGFHNLEKVRDTNKVVTMAVNPKSNVIMSVSYSTAEDVMEYIENESPSLKESEKLILIFAANLMDDEVWNKFKGFDCRVVIFCDPENIEILTAKFKAKNKLFDFPIKGCELSIEKQNWVFEHGQVLIQGREMKIKDILADVSTMSEILSGNLLNKMLKNEKPTLFGNYLYPECKGVYIERKLSLNENENDKELKRISVAVNWSTEDLSDSGVTQVFKNIQQLEDEIDSVKLDCKYILLTDHKTISNEIIEKCDAAFSSRIVFFMDYECVVNSSTAKYPKRHSKNRKHNPSENEFLEIIRPKNMKTFFFRAESGMGKSELLKSLGKRMENSLVIFCACRKFVDVLQKIVGTIECTKTNAKHVFFQILGCKDECERNVIGSLLDRKGGAGRKVELQLDGLDEVPREHLKLALKTLKIIENDFESVRLWITSSRPFPCEMEEIKFVEWNISRFTYDDKHNFFEQYWTEKPSNGTDKQRVEEIERFVDRIITFTNVKSSGTTQNELTDYPLFCSMIAELYQDNFTKHVRLPKSVNQLDLYESLVKKKFALMMKKKVGKEPETGDTDFRLLEDGYMQMHKYFSLDHLFPELSSYFTKPSAMKFLKEEDICRMRIITSIEPPAFVHLSYAHFFVARFIIDGIQAEELDNLCSKETFDNILLSGSPDESYLHMTTFLWEPVNRYLREIQDWSSLKWLKSHNNEKHRSNNYNSTFLTYVIENHLWDLARLLIIVQKSKMDSVECHKILELAFYRWSSIEMDH